MAEKPILGYWGIKGRGHSPRTLLKHLGVDFEDKRIASPEEWGELKASLPMPFPNLPYYIDGDVKHSETMAIMRSICRKYKPEYLGRDLAEQAKVDALTNSLNDAFFAKVFGPCIFSQDWAANKAASGEADAKALLETIVSIKGSNKFLFGNEPTYGDFIIAGVCVVTQLWDASIVEAMPAIQEYIGTFLALENVAAYNEEDAATPLLPQIAGWMKDNFPA